VAVSCRASGSRSRRRVHPLTIRDMITCWSVRFAFNVEGLIIQVQRSSSANLRNLKTLEDGTIFHHLSSFTDSNPFPHPSSVITPNSLTLKHGSSVSRRPRYYFPTECPVVSFLTCPPTFNLQVLLHSPTTVPNPSPACSCSRPICSVLRPSPPSGSEMPDKWGYHTSRTAQDSGVPSFV